MNLKMKKPTLGCCFTWIVFVELKENLGWPFVSKVGRWGVLKNWWDPSYGGMILKWGVDSPLRLWTITKHILPNIPLSKGNQTMTFGQLMEYNKKNIYLQKSYGKWGWEISFTTSFCCPKALYEVKASSLELSFNILW